MSMMSVSGSPRKSFNSGGSLHVSDLGSTASSPRLAMKNFERSTNDEEFVQTCAQQSRNIQNVRKDIQVLMTKASGYCKNTGLSSDSAELPSTPPRYSGKTKFSVQSSPYSPRNQNGSGFFNSSLL
ncbi:hypothetical protein TVAG_266560 [Trichomonas vaginalis G3]|uniref:Uncharacterized protein n=1 Tax=Trichomonas vaginalis (strain ATCC PRA-98 / G3) TaxID=412133 RepID=A2DQK9_TRIV3|nr:hypothetical protein TVAGG3_0591540 [Trichomonas vaginalis G3]EAY17293.1 hypothetical protein TVAG_266560 [Trichomonas vaginalis G3]KAI5523294.1 hypothetical protein TVAGG3_0591540 [Trichomonas vaginalis G3]|eukprot:XP_001329516.1 hypothetical protein [Trichomonas vaginalis G3]